MTVIRQATETPIHVHRFAEVRRDDELRLEALRRKDAAAWTELFEEHRDLVFRSALTHVREPALAEDITGQVFLEAIEGIGRYRDRGKPMAAWLLTITRHRSLDALRKMRRDRSTALEASAGTWAMTTAPALDALGDLTVEQREVIHLRFVEDRTVEDIARITGRSTAAVKSLQHRALRQLRARIEQKKAGGTTHV